VMCLQRSGSPSHSVRLLLTCAACLLGAVGTSPIHAQAPEAVVTGRVLDAATGAPLAGTLVVIEGTDRRSVADSAGRFLLLRVPPGPQMLRAERIGYALTRMTLTVPATGTVMHELRMASSALQMPGLIVTADPAGRARGELGTASVIEREAIRHQTAASLAGLLELVPGIPMSPPGLDGVQQVSLRSVPISGTGGEAIGPNAAALASAGTLIVMDGVPLSNNANLQTLGPRGELPLSSSAGGGIDLRRIPAALIDRIEVIRGVPSARYGDLTQGAVIVDTRAGAVDSDVAFRRDRQTGEASLLGGSSIGEAHAGTVMVNFARTLLQPGVRDDEAYRAAAQLAHRLRIGRGEMDAGEDRLTLDTRVDYYRLFQDSPENPDIQPGRASASRDSGLRVSERARLRLGRGTLIELSAAVDHQQQRSYTQALRQRGASPFTRQLTEGRAIGHFIGGSYIARVDVDGDPWLAYGRLEASERTGWLGLEHELRLGTELRREWNSGPGYQFDMEFPPQSTFTGVQGFDRPRRYDDVPPVATSALYIDDRVTHTFGGNVHLSVQAGARIDVLHDGTSWLSGSRDAVVQPRLNVQVSPTPWLRLRAGAGRTAKYPTLSNLYPAPQYHDVVNVNWYANDPAERLAVLTTSILDPTNPDLRQMVTTKREAGFEVGFGARGGVLSVVAFDDRIDGAIGLSRTPRHLLREYYQLSDSTFGTGRPPTIIEPAYRADTVPVLLLQPANSLALGTRGFEATLALPEATALQTRLEIQGAWIWTRLESSGLEVGTYFSDFQLRGTQPRTPYWEGTTRTGDRLLLNYRLIHQQPSVGLVITTTVQHVPRESLRSIGGRDSLEFAGYITRTGEVVAVPEAERGREEYRDIQLPRRTLITERTRTLADWLLSVQVSKTLPLDGRLSLYAFNAFDRVGQYPRPGWAQRLHPPVRFGLEVSLSPGAVLARGGR
jgi:outer membrane receptor protein involved in Fe transport